MRRLPDQVRTCTRRRFIEIGTLGVLGLGLTDLLQARTSDNPVQTQRSEKSCIFIVQYGGPSHIDSFDLKPMAPSEIRGPYRPITTSVPGVQIGELLPRLAKLAENYCLIRSMTHHNAGHDGGMHVCMTGYSEPKEGTPYYGSVMAKLHPTQANLPSYVWLQNLAGDVQPRYLTGGSLGAAYSPLRIGNDLDNPSAPHFHMTTFDTFTEVPAARLVNRARILRDIESKKVQGRAPSALGTFQDRAVELVTSRNAQRAFNLEQEPASVRDKYGRHPLGQNLLLARRLIEAGVRLVSVTAWTGVPPGETFRNVQTWDMHGNGAGLGSIFGTGHFGLGWALPRLDEGVSALLEDLEVRGLLQNTLVVLVGEFGRAPKVVNAGRDHWPTCYSSLIAGAGIRGGAVYGASDKSGAHVLDRPVSPEDFGATLFHALGVAPETRLSADGFTQPASAGRPLMELFG